MKSKQELRQIKAHYQKQIDRATKAIKEAENDYIRENAPYPIGTKLKIDDYGNQRDVQIQSYKIDENGLLEPVFVSLKGKCVFTHKPTIIDTID